MSVLLFFGELVILFLLSQSVSRSLSQFFFFITRNQKITTYLLAFVFLPGTIIHELAHAAVASILLVPLGKMEFMPQEREGRLKLGSVQVGQTDPIRNALIGFAPVFVGLGIIVLLLYNASLFSFLSFPWNYIVIGLLLFEVGNTMFSSRKDLEGTIELLVALILLGVVLSILGARVPPVFWSFLTSPSFLSVFQKGGLFLLVPIGVNLAVTIGVQVLLLTFKPK